MLKERLEQLVDSIAEGINALKIAIFGADPQPLEETLLTQDRTSIVAALNEIVRRLDAIENTPQ